MAMPSLFFSFTKANSVVVIHHQDDSLKSTYNLTITKEFSWVILTQYWLTWSPPALVLFLSCASLFFSQIHLEDQMTGPLHLPRLPQSWIHHLNIFWGHHLNKWNLINNETFFFPQKPVSWQHQVGLPLISWNLKKPPAHSPTVRLSIMAISDPC